MPTDSLFDEYQRMDFLKRLKAGESFPCPCCKRHAQIYKRRIHHSVARQLIAIYHLGCKEKRDFVKTIDLMLPGYTGACDLGKPVYWGLLEKKEREPNEVSAGLWRLTPFGVSFVKGEATIKEVALVFDDTVLGFEGKQVSIKFCLKKKFDYEQLMAGV